MKTRFLFLMLIAAAMFSVVSAQSPEKRLLKDRWDTLRAQLEQAGILDQVLASKNLDEVTMSSALRSDIEDLKADYKAFLQSLNNNNGRLTLSNETEPNNALTTADPFGDNDALRGNIPLGNVDEDWFKFSVTNPDSIIILDVTNTTGETATSDSIMELYDPNGNLALTDDDGGSAGGESRIAFSALVPGNWYARLIPFDENASVDTYDLYAVHAVTEDSGVALATGESNYHTFDAPAGESVRITVFVDNENAEQDLDIFLREGDNPVGTVIASEETGNINFEYITVVDLPYSGTYTVEVFSFDSSGEPANYEIAIDPTTCAVAHIVYLPEVGDTGLTIDGTPGCTYTVTYTDANGNQTVYDITIGPNGLGVDNSHPIPPESTIEVNDEGVVGSGIGGLSTVPTLGTYGMIGFLILLMGAALITIRKTRS